MPTKKSNTFPEQHVDLFAPYQARAAELGLSVEEFVTQRLAHLQETQPELYDELTDKLASAALQALRIFRNLSAKLQSIEDAVQELGDPHSIRLMRDVQQWHQASCDDLAAASLLGSDEENLLPV